jgi:hypothetical protein
MQTWYILNYRPLPQTELTRRDNAVGTVTGYGQDNRAVGWSPSSSRVCTPFLGNSQPPMRWVSGKMRSGRQAQYSLATNAKIKDTLRALYIGSSIRLCGLLLS